jgi:UTP--glucose-1-phosphate uridylyltransferase
LKIRKAVIPAAGYGTRFLPTTKATAKEMINIVDKPAIQYIVEEAVKSGIEEILIITSRNKSAIENHFDVAPELEQALKVQGKDLLLKMVEDTSDLADIYYKRQKEMKGLGHAILQAKSFVGDEPFAVLLGDDIVDHEKPCLKQLVDVYLENHGNILGVQKVAKEEVSKYGIVSGRHIKGREYEVLDLVEKPSIEEAPSDLAILGRYILSPTIFSILEQTPPGKNGEIQLTDALLTLLQKEPMVAYDFEGSRYDTGQKLGYLKATVDLALKHPEVKEAFQVFLKDKFK